MVSVGLRNTLGSLGWRIDSRSVGGYPPGRVQSACPGQNRCAGVPAQVLHGAAAGDDLGGEPEEPVRGPGRGELGAGLVVSCVLGFGRDVEVEREQLREQVVVGREPVGAEYGGVEVCVRRAEPALAGLRAAGVE